MASVRKRTWTTRAGEQKTAWMVDYFDAGGNRERKQFATKREANDFRIETEGKVKTGTYRADAGKMTIAELCEDYLEYAAGRTRRNERFTRRHLEAVTGLVRNHILHNKRGIGALKIDQLTARSVGDFRDRLRDNDLTVPTTRKVINRLKVILDYAISRDVIAVNAARGVQVIGRRDEGSKKIVPPSKDVVNRLLRAADDAFRVKVAFACATGVRAGELHALRWKHINFDAMSVKIETRVDFYKCEDVPKTEAGEREIPLSQPIVRSLKEWRLRTRFARQDDLIFPNTRGDYTGHQNMIHRQYKPLFAVIGEPPMNWHALRHFAISTWIEAGFSPKAVQTFAGHSSLQVTLDRYGHLFPAEDHSKMMNEIAVTLFADALTHGTQMAHA